MKRVVLVLSLATAFVVPVANPKITWAQEQSGSTVPSRVCMSRDLPAGKVYIIVPNERRLDMAGRGFVLTPCNGREGSVDKYRNEICKLANSASAQTLELVRRSYGVGADELCTMAGGEVGR